MSVQTYQWSNTRRSSFRIDRWTWAMRGWLLMAVVLAVFFHWWLYKVVLNMEFGQTVVMTESAAQGERLTIDPDLLKDKKAVTEIPDYIAPAAEAIPEPDIKADMQDIVDALPDDRELNLTPEVNKVTNFMSPDSLPNSTTPALSPGLAEVAESISAGEIASAANAIKSSALSKAVSPNQLVLPTKPLDKHLEGIDGAILDKINKPGVAGNAAAARVQGFSNLDDLLGRGKALTGSTDPIMLPTDLLFDYGSDQLAESARLSLMKLGLLIQRNPNHRFIIEGHTDTFGSDQFNIELSQRRANAVVSWLTNSLNLTTDRITAMGMGRTKVLVPGGSREDQAINRRVEIKIRPLR